MTGVQQRRPPAFVIEGADHPVNGEVLADRRRVAEHGHSRQAARGDSRIGAAFSQLIPTENPRLSHRLFFFFTTMFASSLSNLKW